VGHSHIVTKSKIRLLLCAGGAAAALALPTLIAQPGRTDYVPIASVRADDAAPSDSDVAEHAFEILDTNCARCHGDGKRLSAKAAIGRDDYDKLVNVQKLVIPNKSDQSVIYTILSDPNNPMPPARLNKPVSQADQDAIKLWIDRGAPAWPTTPPANAPDAPPPGAPANPAPAAPAAPAAN